MVNFWDFSVWGYVNIVAVLLLSLLVANMLKKQIAFLRNSLIPTSVLGGAILLIISAVYKAITGNVMFNTEFFGGNGMSDLEVITYHALALGFIATSLKTTNKKISKQRTKEIFDSGVTTVATYLLQAMCGLGITIVSALIIDGFFSCGGGFASVRLRTGHGIGT